MNIFFRNDLRNKLKEKKEKPEKPGKITAKPELESDEESDEDVSRLLFLS